MRIYLNTVTCLYVLLWMSALTSCTGISEDGPEGALRDSLVDWEMTLNGTRAEVGSDGRGYFEEGDTVVVYARNMADGSLRHYTLHLSGGSWLPAIYWSEIGEDVEFTAWYLAAASRLHETSLDSPAYCHEIAAMQQGRGYEDSDLLCSKVYGKPGGKVHMYFRHALSRLVVVLESSDGSYTPEQLEQMDVQVNTPCRLPLDLSSGTFQSPSDNRWVTPSRHEGSTWTALVAPQSAGSMAADGWVKVTVDGNVRTVGIPESVGGIPFTGMEPGKELTYRLDLKKGDDTDPFAGTTRWVYGVKEPSDEQWNMDHTQLLWMQGCGWFDCNKVNPSDVSSGGDGLMCWAAASTNLIHWWLQQNSDTGAVKAYTGPSAIPSDMLHSEIFQMFKDRFPNRGEYPVKALNWFFNGVFQRRIYDSDPVDPAAGFFREWLGASSLAKEYSGADMKKDRFNTTVRQALASGQGIMFVVNLGKAWSTHAVTLWGVKFDDNGLIETLYMVDNNDGRNDSRGTIRTMDVRYLPYSGTDPDLYPYVPNSLGDFTIRIESLCTLSLGRELIGD